MLISNFRCCNCQIRKINKEEAIRQPVAIIGAVRSDVTPIKGRQLFSYFLLTILAPKFTVSVYKRACFRVLCISFITSNLVVTGGYYWDRESGYGIIYMHRRMSRLVWVIQGALQ